MIEKYGKRLGLIAVILIMTALPVTASDIDEEGLFGSSSSQEDSLFGGSSEDTLFGGSAGGSDDLVSEITSSDTKMGELLLTGDQPVVIGGSYSFSMTPGWGWKFEDNKEVAGLQTSMTA
nr:hypothetical protein [Spirochaetales bacterium]